MDPHLLELFNYSSGVLSLLLTLTLLLFFPLLVIKLMKRSYISFYHSQKSIMQRIPYFTRLSELRFTPTVFFPSGNMQTVVLPFMSHKENTKRHLWNFEYQRGILKLSDGGQTALDWVKPRDSK